MDKNKKMNKLVKKVKKLANKYDLALSVDDNQIEESGKTTRSLFIYVNDRGRD